MELRKFEYWITVAGINKINQPSNEKGKGGAQKILILIFFVRFCIFLLIILEQTVIRTDLAIKTPSRRLRIELGKLSTTSRV